MYLSELSHGYFQQKVRKNHTSNSDTPPFTYTIERITDRDIEADQVEENGTEPSPC